MSVWLLRRPQSLSQVHPIFVSSRFFHYARRNSLQVATAHHGLWLPHPRPAIALKSRRWQSTKETTSPEAQVPAEAKQTSVSTSSSDDSPKPSTLTRAWKKVKHEAQHYWNGSKLLVSEVRISGRLQWKILQGETLTRRERRQLKRTTQDLLRLVPFAVFVIVPFMELLLPVALKLFPNMLPSTFEDKFAAEEKQRKLLRVRLEMAKFLQETLRESGLKANRHIIGSDALKEFFRKVRSTGESPSTTDIVNVAKLFDDDLTLDNLSRPQLVSMCRYMGLNAFGTDNFLRGAIRARLVQLRRDDQLIDNEGIDSLSTAELQHACQSRGIRTIGVSPSRLRQELTTWIKLHLHNRVSGVLLVLGRAFYFDRKPGESEENTTIKALESVLSSLPDNLLNEAELEVDSEKASYKQKLGVLQQQEELIEDEEEQEHKEEEARRLKKEADEKAKREEELLMAESLLPESEVRQEEQYFLRAEAEQEDARMTTEQLAELAEALSILSAKSSVLKERDELRVLMEENTSAEEDPKSSSAPLVKRIRSMITKIDNQLEAYDSKVGNSLQMISCDSQGRISVEDLQKALAVIKHKPDEEVGHAVIQKLDVDKDGFVELEHVLGLVREEGLGIVMDGEAQDLIGEGKEIKNAKPRKEDIVQE
ncbi:LETM1-domain-containing protein [Schizopora paradoxa]|uniref:Mitochondrial proton/calcium exchanger protein n=1 Tax=Schizopora paradoxa TaxID=27342 RepID=A0A0H2SA32_9AGAM|nr:LETM1-domain-containing protein [Schizopora paradoxa]